MTLENRPYAVHIPSTNVSLCQRQAVTLPNRPLDTYTRENQIGLKFLAPR